MIVFVIEIIIDNIQQHNVFVTAKEDRRSQSGG